MSRPAGEFRLSAARTPGPGRPAQGRQEGGGRRPGAVGRAAAGDAGGHERGRVRTMSSADPPGEALEVLRDGAGRLYADADPLPDLPRVLDHACGLDGLVVADAASRPSRRLGPVAALSAGRWPGGGASFAPPLRA